MKKLTATIFGLALIGFAVYLTRNPHCLWGLIPVWLIVMDVKDYIEIDEINFTADQRDAESTAQIH